MFLFFELSFASQHTVFQRQQLARVFLMKVLYHCKTIRKLGCISLENLKGVKERGVEIVEGLVVEQES